MAFTQRFCCAVIGFAACSITLSLNAATVVSQTYSGSYPTTIAGTLPNQGTALEEMFTLPGVSNFTAYTTSYATGGFEPNLTLFDSHGNYVASSGTPGTSPKAQIDPATGLALDAYLSTRYLAVGQYTLALTDWELNQSITATNLSDGFTSNYGNGRTFVDQALNVRTGSYSLSAQVSQTPEPATVWLGVPLLGIIAIVTRKRKSFSK